MAWQMRNLRRLLVSELTPCHRQMVGLAVTSLPHDPHKSQCAALDRPAHGCGCAAAWPMPPLAVPLAFFIIASWAATMPRSARSLTSAA